MFHTGRTVEDADASGGTAVLAEPCRDPVDVLVYGPFRRFDAGRYRARFRIKTSEAFEGSAAELHVRASGGRVIATTAAGGDVHQRRRPVARSNVNASRPGSGSKRLSVGGNEGRQRVCIPHQPFHYSLHRSMRLKLGFAHLTSATTRCQATSSEATSSHDSATLGRAVHLIARCRCWRRFDHVGGRHGRNRWTTSAEYARSVAASSCWRARRAGAVRLYLLIWLGWMPDAIGSTSCFY